VIFCRIDRVRGNCLRPDRVRGLVAELATFSKTVRARDRRPGIVQVQADLVAVNDLDNCQTDQAMEIVPAWVIDQGNCQTVLEMGIGQELVIDLVSCPIDRATATVLGQAIAQAICLQDDRITKTIWLIVIYIANISTITLETTRRICRLMVVDSGVGILVGIGAGMAMPTTGGVGRLGVRLQDGCLISGHNQCRTTMAITVTTKATRFTTKGKRSQQQTNMPRRRRQSLPMFRR
jgi:hypothetical protein